MFNKSEMLDGTKYDFLKQKLSEDFQIPDNNRSKMIFGYNGVGKTTIYRYIRDYKRDDRISFLDYIDERNDFIKNRKKIQVSADVIRINTLNDEIQTLKSEMGIKYQLINNFNITNSASASPYGIKIKKAQKDIFAGFKASRSDIGRISSTLGDIPPKVLLENMVAINNTLDVQEEINEFKNSEIYKSLIILGNVVIESDTTCPVCDSEFPNIKDKINKKMTLLSESKSLIVENLRKNNIQPSEGNINKLIETKQLLTSSELIADWMICNGDITRFDSIVAKHTLLEEKKTEMTELITVAEKLYNSLKVSENKIKSDISRYFSIEVDNIVFNNKKKTLSITLPREVNTYSTGEMNLLSFLIRIYEFIGSDKNILILDDPVSSLDIINHYKIVYEIVKAANSGKTLIILTHSIDMMNAINSQYSRDFDFYYIDEDENELYIQDIPRRDSGKNILTLETVIEVDEKDIIAALIEKENSPFNSDIHKLFHYDGSFSLDGYPNISNDYFVSLIENFIPLTKQSFSINSYSKVIYIAALRVWIESKIRALLQENETLVNEFDSIPTLSEKISVLFRRNGTTTMPIPENLSREGLMSKKVMLNQGIHYQSQVMPFAYALNISLNELNNEIEDVKNMFS